MNTVVDAQAIVSELGTLLKLPDLKLNDQGVASLIADKSFSVSLEYSAVDEVIHLYSKVMDLDGPVSDVICRKLMALNAYGNETGGASFAWDELHHEIILWKRVDLQVANPHYLMKVLERFLDQVERWRTRLERGLEGLEDPTDHVHSADVDLDDSDNSGGKSSPHNSKNRPAPVQINAIRG